MRRSAKTAVVVAFFMLGGCATLDPAAAPDGAPDAGRSGAPDAGAATAQIPWVLAKAEKALAAGNHLEAYKAFSEVLKRDNNNVTALIGLGESMLLGGEPEKALGVFAKVEQIAGDEQKGVALQGQGLSLLAMGNYTKSEVMFERAVAAKPDLWRAWNALGLIKDRAGMGEQARQHYDRSLQASPDAIAATNNKGMSYFLERRYAEAEKEFKEVLKRAPDMTQARNNLRLALAWQGKYIEAITGTKKEEMPTVLNNLGYIAAMRGDYEYAEAYLAQAIQLSPSYYSKAAENLEYVRQLKNEKKNKNKKVISKKEEN